MVGRETILANKATYGEIMYRPVDKRENYVKRCVGMPGDTLTVIDNQVCINGIEAINPENLQFAYYVETDGAILTEEQFRLLGINKSDRELISMDPVFYRLPMTNKAAEMARRIPTVKQVRIEPDELRGTIYPTGYRTGWSRDNFGPLWIPKKGETIRLDERNLALYHRCIRNYENNSLEVTPDGRVLINGIQETSYTFKYDYYFMMGDNRHNSLDSRAWGFVPEDHIVGKPILIWLSLEKDRGLFSGGIRWNRMFRMVHPN
jgi:signal peptidase I